MPTAAEVRRHIRHRNLARKVRFTASLEATNRKETSVVSNQQARLDRVDPKKLLIGANVRRDTKLNESFIDSIREHGVLDPIQVQQLPDGYEVIDGQRRTLAAIDADLDEVPILVRATVTPDDQRVVEQVVFNAQREDLSATESVDAIHQLTLFGLEAGEISKKLARPRTEVDNAIAVAGSLQARSALETTELTLEQAATLVEFESHPAVMKKLAETHAGNFDYAVREARRNAEKAVARKAALEQLKAAGTTIVKEVDYYAYAGPEAIGRQLNQLVNSKGKPITAAAHKKCPGHAAFVHQDTYMTTAEIVYVCTDWKANGHSRNSTGRTMTADEIAEQEARDQARAERAEAVRISTELRNTFVEQLLQRDIAKLAGIWPTLTRGLISRAMRMARSSWGNTSPERIAANWLGLTIDTNGTELAAIEDALLASKLKPLAVALAVSLAPYEYCCTSNLRSLGLAEYYAALTSWGYEPSDFETAEVAAHLAEIEAERQRRLEQEQPAAASDAESADTDPE